MSEDEDDANASTENGETDYELNPWQLDILKNKLPSQAVLRFNVLLALDVFFRFNRTRLAKCLESNCLLGYSRANLYKILGSPVFTPDAYESLFKAFGTEDSEILGLILARAIYRTISNRQFRNTEIVRKRKK